MPSTYQDVGRSDEALQEGVFPFGVESPVADWLNRCLRTELSAVETYDLAICTIGRAELTNVLRDMRASHEKRAILLREHLLAEGARPSESSGIWGAFAKAVQAGADLLGERVGVSALEQFEDHASSLYVELPGRLDMGARNRAARDLLDEDLLPEQRRTSDLCHLLVHLVAGS